METTAANIKNPLKYSFFKFTQNSFSAKMKSLTILVVVAIAFTLALGQDETSSGTEGGGDGTEGGHHGGRKPHPDCPGLF